MGEALDKCSYGRVHRIAQEFEHLQQVKDHIRAPTEDENENYDKGHLDGLHFGLGNQSS